MKIASVETFHLRFPVDPYRYGACSKGWIRDRSSLLVRVWSDAGVEAGAKAAGRDRPNSPRRWSAIGSPEGKSANPKGNATADERQ